MNSDFMRWLLDLRSIPKGADDLYLGFERQWDPWVWFLLLLAAAALAGWSYWRLVGGRGGRLVLAAVRFAIIVLALVLIAGPMIELPRESVEQDWVLVLADRSGSMTIADVATQAGGATLGAGGAGPRRQREDQLRGILRDNEATWRELAANRHLVWLGFHGGAFDLAESPAGRDSQPDATAAAVPDLGEPTGQRTAINAAIEQALQRAAARPLSGIVLLSDGRTADPPTRATLRRLQADKVPVFVVPLGSPEPLGDLAIRRIDAPRRAFVRDQVPIEVELSRLGSAAQQGPAVVKLVDQQTGEVLDQVEINHGDESPPGAGTAESDRVTLTAKPDLAGTAEWQVVVETNQPDLIPGNNVRPLTIELIDRPLRILYVEGYPRWEYRFVKNLLIREKSFESSIMLLSADPDFAQEGNQPITRLPRSPEEFADYDVVIIGDVPGPFFSPQQLEMIRDHVAERGAGLLWIGGERATPSTYGLTALADVLPMRPPLALPPLGKPVNMEPTPLAERLGVLSLTAGMERSASGALDSWPVELTDPAYAWSQLHYAQRIEPGRLKPTAETLAQTVQEFSGDHMPLVIAMRFGAGQTIYVATDEIWRWRYARGEMLPEQFWVQMIRMLGRESLSGGADGAVLTVEPSRVPVNQPIRIVLRVTDAQLVQQQRVSVPAVLESEDGSTIADIDLRRLEGSEDRFAATFLPDVTGNLRVRLDDPQLRQLALVATVEVYRADDELRSPETEHELLATLAAETGGGVLTPDEVKLLPARLPNRAVTTVNPLTEPIWNTPLAFGLVVLLLTAEWIGRKLLRLV